MKISRIEFENFRNFRDHGEIRCATDGKVTIIYGKNGDGKTTLHQLLQWILYGQVHFNRTTTDHLYNLQFEKEQTFGAVFQVMGRIDFMHDDRDYSLTRTNTYKKELSESKKISEEMTLLKKSAENDWKPVDNPKEIIEKMLPSGLSEYFFFDGESMIADLRVKGRDSASKLRKALYSMFDLDIIESAISHVGRTELKTTALGKLYLSKGSVASGGEISAIKTNIEGAQGKLKDYGDRVEKEKNERKQNQNLISEISEKIGRTKSKSDYEKQRKGLIQQRDQFLKNAEIYQANFGDAIMEMFPQLFISKAVSDAKTKINLKVEKSTLPPGLSKELILYLLSDEATECICGHPLSAEEREHIERYLEMMPPQSYKNLYDNFSKTAAMWGMGYNKKGIESWIRMVLDNREQAVGCDQKIRDLDEEEKNIPDIEALVVARQEAESRIQELNESIDNLEIERKKFAMYLKKANEKFFDDLTQASDESKRVQRKIDILQQVVDYFSKRLEEESIYYSHQLQANIQDLIDQMLTSKRSVSVNSEFAVRVTDSFNDESKSEGQFAVVSFAYIGGILKMLKNEEHLTSKEYPLVLDGPFSKLDPDQRQNVVNTIPQFAPQVILFSKDSLQDVFNTNDIGRIWTIESNDEKNVASVKEGYFMEITTDIQLRGTAWNTAIESLGKIFKNRTNYNIYMLCLSIGVMYDQRIANPEELNEEPKSVPRNVLQNNDNGKLDFIFQAAILSTSTEILTEDERLELAFGENVDFNRLAFLTQFANYGVTKLVELIGNDELESMENIKNFATSTVEGRNLDIDALSDEILLLDDDDELFDSFS